MPVLRQLGDAAFSCAPGYYQPSPEYTACIPNDWIRVPGCWIGPAVNWPGVCPTLSCGRELCPTAPAAPAPAPVAAYTPAAPAPAPVSPYTATPAESPVSEQGKAVVAPKITVETSEGPVEISADFVPGVSDGSLTPVQIRIPNVWDSLDPSKQSQFEYRGLATSLPVWISDRWRQTLATAAGAVTPGSPIPGAGGDPVAVDGEIPLWVWAAIGAAAWMMRDKSRAVAFRRRAAA